MSSHKLVAVIVYVVAKFPPRTAEVDGATIEQVVMALAPAGTGDAVGDGVGDAVGSGVGDAVGFVNACTLYQMLLESELEMLLVRGWVMPLERVCGREWLLQLAWRWEWLLQWGWLWEKGCLSVKMCLKERVTQ